MTVDTTLHVHMASSSSKPSVHMASSSSKPSVHMAAASNIHSATPSSSKDHSTDATLTKRALPNPTNLVSLDCEMVGCGAKGRISVLARCSIVDYEGEVVYDSYIKPMMPVTDYRYKYSGIRKKHLVNAPTFAESRVIIKRHLRGKYIVGHDLRNDFTALKIKVDPALVKDTSSCVALRYLAGLPSNKTPSLRKLTGLINGRTIQEYTHCSVEDARETMRLYRLVENKWDTVEHPCLEDSYWNVVEK